MLCRNFLISCNPTCQILLLLPQLQEFFSWSLYLYLQLQMFTSSSSSSYIKSLHCFGSILAQSEILYMSIDFTQHHLAQEIWGRRCLFIVVDSFLYFLEWIFSIFVRLKWWWIHEYPSESSILFHWSTCLFFCHITILFLLLWLN